MASASVTAILTATAPRVPVFHPVPRLWSGERTVVIGGGPSLTADDVEACRGKARVVAIKEAHLLAPWADVLYACESKWWTYYGGVPSFRGPKFSYEGTEFPDVHRIGNGTGFGLETDPAQGVRHGFNSGYQAVNLAVHLGGPGTVILLGFDMHVQPDGKQNWFGDHPNHTKGSPYGLFRECFTTMVGPLETAGVHVLNATRSTSLTVFPIVPLDEALRS